MKRLILGVLLAAVACGPYVPPYPQTNYYVDRTPAELEAAHVYTIATTLQLNPAADPKTRADPYPCARATVAAENQHTPLPPCYYRAVGGGY